MKLNRHSRGIALWLLVLAADGVDISHAAPSPSCRRVALEPAPESTFDATWSSDERELVVVDVGGGRILRFSPDGRFLGSIARPGQGELEFNKPSQIHATEEGFVLRNVASHWIWLDRQYKPFKASGWGLRTPFNLVDEELMAGEVNGFGTAKKDDGSWVFGLLRARLSPASLVQIVEEISLSSKAGTFYIGLAPMVARAGGSVYALRLDEPPYLLKVNPRARLQSFPEGFDRLPVLPEHTGLAAAVPRQNVIEKSKLPVALYGQGRFLYVLTREPAETGKTSWLLYQIDPVKDRLLKTVRLPTSAKALAIAPGSKFWGILEKGPMQPSGRQEATNLLLIPSLQIESGKIGAGQCR